MGTVGGPGVSTRPLNNTEYDFFATPDVTTDLSAHAKLVAALPSDPAALGEIVRGLLLHNSFAALSGMEFPPERMADMKRVGAATIIQRILELDSRQLDEERPPQSRMIGFCYHFALLHCAFLRAKGVPARARCGFAAYFRPDAWIDHWVCEYWDGQKWALNDSQIGLNDLTRDDFHDAGIAWMLCRSGDADPFLHGNEVLWGWDELRGSLVNDIGALNKIEVGDWWWCDLIKVEPLDQPDQTLDLMFDDLALLVAGDADFEAMSRAFQDEVRLHPPTAVIANNGPS